jgi:hypothetical protein
MPAAFALNAIHRARRDENGSVQRSAFAFDTTGNVDRVTKHCKLKSLLATDIADDHVPGMDVDTLFSSMTM